MPLPTPRLENLLVRNGWSPSRSVDVTRIANILTRRGYEVHSAARQALAKFGDLSLELDEGNELHRLAWRVVVFGKRLRPRWPAGRTLLQRLQRGPSADSVFFEQYLGIKACVVGRRLLRHNSSLWEDCEWLYVIDDGSAMACEHNWHAVVWFRSFIELLDYGLGGSQAALERSELISLDCPEANETLARLGIFGRLP